MRTAHDWGRAFGRPRKSATASRKLHLTALAPLAAIACLVGCGEAANNNDMSTAPANGGDTRALEATRSVASGVVYPTVTVQPTASTTMTVGQTLNYTALLEDASSTWTACCVKWTSSDTTIVSITTTGYGKTAGDVGIAIAKRAGKATISATTESATSGGMTITVGGTSSAPPPSGTTGSTGGSSGGGGATSTAPASPPPSGGTSGSVHEPAGMTGQINTGAIKSTSVISMFSPSTRTSLGEWSGNLSVVPGGTGLRLTYPTGLAAGYSPVRFGMTIPSAGTGWYYQRMKIRFSSNWSLSGNTQMKLCEPRTRYAGAVQGPAENHVVGLHADNTYGAASWFYVMLQGPNSHFRDLYEQPYGTAADNVSDGNWHTVEILFGPESTPGAGNGSYTGWVDGVQIEHYTDVLWLAPGNQAGWPYLMFDPTFGGGPHSPDANMYWDFDQLYVSTK